MTGGDPALPRERRVVAAALLALVLAAWAYLWTGAGMGMSAADMTRATLFPHRQADVLGEMESSWWMVVAMWWTMMVAMMTPSAAPLILLHGRVLRHHAGTGGAAYASSLLVACGYLLAWMLFSLAAAALQQALQPAGLISSMMLWSKSAWLSALVLAAAGAYQFSPLKRACLTQCRGPVDFLTRHWKPGRAGALLLGLRHGAYCVGCCWVLMLLLFVGGIMNLVWIAALTLLVLAEKLLPSGVLVSRITGGLLLVWAVATMLV